MFFNRNINICQSNWADGLHFSAFHLNSMCTKINRACALLQILDLPLIYLGKLWIITFLTSGTVPLLFLLQSLVSKELLQHLNMAIWLPPQTQVEQLRARSLAHAETSLVPTPCTTKRDQNKSRTGPAVERIWPQANILRCVVVAGVCQCLPSSWLVTGRVRRHKKY